MARCRRMVRTLQGATGVATLHSLCAGPSRPCTHKPFDQRRASAQAGKLLNTQGEQKNYCSRPVEPDQFKRFARPARTEALLHFGDVVFESPHRKPCQLGSRAVAGL